MLLLQVAVFQINGITNRRPAPAVTAYVTIVRHRYVIDSLV